MTKSMSMKEALIKTPGSMNKSLESHVKLVSRFQKEESISEKWRMNEISGKTVCGTAWCSSFQTIGHPH